MKRLMLLGLVLGLVATATNAAEGIRVRLAAGVYGDTKGAGLREPEGVAFSGKGFVVADTSNGRIVRFAIAADRIEAQAEYTIAELPYPIRIASGPSGDMAVLDGRLHRVARVSAAGEFKGYVELPGAGKSAVPRAITIDRGGLLWILDIAGARVVALDAAGKSAREIALPLARDAFFSDLAVDGKGSVFALDSVGRRVYVAKAGAQAFEPFGGSLTEELDFATSFAVDEVGRLFIADQNGGGIVSLGPDGSFRGRQVTLGWKDGMLRYPSAVAIQGDQLLVADRGNNRVQMFAIVQ